MPQPEKCESCGSIHVHTIETSRSFITVCSLCGSAGPFRSRRRDAEKAWNIIQSRQRLAKEELQNDDYQG